jgi:hypothetical protein
MFRTSLDWYEELEKEMGLEWQRPPVESNSSE